MIALGYYFCVTNEVKLSEERLALSQQSVTIYDKNGAEVRGVSSLIKQTTPLKDISPYLTKAFVATEDKRFYKHGGYDFKRILRAVANNFKAKSFKEGASTISQQLIKNTHLTQEKTVKRKLKEWKLTRALERKYTKEEILEKYLNSIYFGHGCFGITSAADYYFGKSPKELTLADAAILTGLVKAPNYYSPFKNTQACQKRKSVVLACMFRNNAITQLEREKALNEPLPPSSQTKKEGGYLHFVFDELTELSERFGFTVGGKIEIQTYLDPDLQQSLEKIAESYTASDKIFLVLDGQTKGFKGCVATVDNIPRLPGSIIKPILVYAPAIEEDILSPATPILDEKINYDGYSPENYDGKYHGYVSARECVEKSLNVPAVKTLASLTVEKGAEYLNKLGLPIGEKDKSLALALGGMEKGYTLKNLLSAYATLQSQGRYESGSFISSIKINGATVYKKSLAQTQVFSEETACLITDMLKTTVQKGTAKKLRALPFDIAAKTGTVGTKNGNTDAYALSYTTRDCAAVWLGNANNDKIEETGGTLPCELLAKINEALYLAYQENGTSIHPFPISKKVRYVELDSPSYYDTHTLCLADDNAPKNYRIKELFKTNAIPLNKSTSFTCPSIVPPTLSVEKNGVQIHFDKRSPRYYQYKIERYDYVTHTTIYLGEYTPTFLDDKLDEGKNYLYTITPIYEGREGKSIVLPMVTTNKGESTEIQKEDILSKKWWEY